MPRRSSSWVLDASPLINLVASGCLPEILAATQSRFVVVDRAAREVILNPREGGEPYPLEPLFRDGVLARVVLSERASSTFVDLVGAGDDDLGDGEAATIAHAVDTGFGVILDDTKARRVCAERFPSVPVLSTIELLRHEQVTAALGAERHSSAVFDALLLARMRVLNGHEEWVRNLVGEERADICPSLRRRRRLQ